MASKLDHKLFDYRFKIGSLYKIGPNSDRDIIKHICYYLNIDEKYISDTVLLLSDINNVYDRYGTLVFTTDTGSRVYVTRSKRILLDSIFSI